MSQPHNYIPPKLGDFKQECNCQRCNKTQPATPTAIKNGSFIMICPSCALSYDIHIPPQKQQETQMTTRCCKSGCNCTDYRPNEPNIICACGHSGAYHSLSHTPVREWWDKPKTLKSQVKSDSEYYKIAQTHEDL
ncbi:hypothetical protein ABK040_007186 [Willaertia magna]